MSTRSKQVSLVAVATRSVRGVSADVKLTSQKAIQSSIANLKYSDATDVWDTVKGKQKVQILDQAVDIERRLAATRFCKFGSLYYKDDLPENSDSTSPLYLDSTGNEIRSKMFGIGRTNHRSFFDFGRCDLDIERGPYKFIPDSYYIITLCVSCTTFRVNCHRIYGGYFAEGNRNCKVRSPVSLNARRSLLWTPTIPA